MSLLYWYEDDRYYTTESYKVKEQEESIDISIVAPGLDKSKMKLVVKNQKLQIYIPEQRERVYHIPDSINLDEISATYVDGILKITLGKKEIISKEIEIK